MVPRIQLFVNVSDDQMIQALFATTFPNCTYTKATFYKHRAAYRAAIENSSDRVERAVNAGYSPAGQWNTLLAEIKANAASSLTGSNSPGSVSNSDTKCMYNLIYYFHGWLILVLQVLPCLRVYQ
jgi:hypothetical protein